MCYTQAQTVFRFCIRRLRCVTKDQRVRSKGCVSSRFLTGCSRCSPQKRNQSKMGNLPLHSARSRRNKKSHPDKPLDIWVGLFLHPHSFRCNHRKENMPQRIEKLLTETRSRLAPFFCLTCTVCLLETAYVVHTYHHYLGPLSMIRPLVSLAVFFRHERSDSRL